LDVTCEVAIVSSKLMKGVYELWLSSFLNVSSRDIPLTNFEYVEIIYAGLTLFKSCQIAIKVQLVSCFCNFKHIIATSNRKTYREVRWRTLYATFYNFEKPTTSMYTSLPRFYIHLRVSYYFYQ